MTHESCCLSDTRNEGYRAEQARSRSPAAERPEIDERMQRAERRGRVAVHLAPRTSLLKTSASPREHTESPDTDRPSCLARRCVYKRQLYRPISAGSSGRAQTHSHESARHRGLSRESESASLSALSGGSKASRLSCRMQRQGALLAKCHKPKALLNCRFRSAKALSTAWEGHPSAGISAETEIPIGAYIRVTW